ncbi:FCS-Like Zinc finger 15-like isoform X2 [Juglans microcarpa x Juglans regia]|uniref:FCS-Like Zinc finger 15-like isoform X2 n=1 Tax=Juglans microcarpa x Juglans regia TaxID=2249226 RepID=UPI001B7E4EB0|nr:FCS-Like Zinc finger 15-like isoform X2 [Juglans microcarpa x Juglans regia]
MVGLSVVLEAQNGGVSKKTTQVINKTAMLLINKSSSPSDLSSSSCKNLHSLIPPGPTFLDQCFLCYEKLLPGKDIYIGDRAFCSVECRCRQIFMDEEESLSKNHCSLAAMKPTSSSSSSSSSTARRQRKGAKNRAGGFAY